MLRFICDECGKDVFLNPKQEYVLDETGKPIIEKVDYVNPTTGEKRKIDQYKMNDLQQRGFTIQLCVNMSETIVLHLCKEHFDIWLSDHKLFIDRMKELRDKN